MLKLKKINTTAKRMLELDAEKVDKRVIEAMGETAELNIIGKHKHCSASELLNRLILWNPLSWPKKKQQCKLLEIDKYEKEGSNGFLKRLG